MTPMEIYGVFMLVVACVFTIAVLYKFKKMKEQRSALEAEQELRMAELKAQKLREREEYRQQEELRKHPNYSHPRFDPKNPDTLLPTKREIAKKYSTTSQTQVVGNNSVGVQSGNDVDWITPALIFATMNSSSGRVSAKVDDAGSVTFKEEPKQDSSYSSSYSSNNDDDRKSSYSSSYSSSSSDDSYSSSSSDSSYSSSFSSD